MPGDTPRYGEAGLSSATPFVFAGDRKIGKWGNGGGKGLSGSTRHFVFPFRREIFRGETCFRQSGAGQLKESVPGVWKYPVYCHDIVCSFLQCRRIEWQGAAKRNNEVVRPIINSVWKLTLYLRESKITILQKIWWRAIRVRWFIAHYEYSLYSSFLILSIPSSVAFEPSLRVNF